MKQLARYKINFDSKWTQASSVLMGAALFIRMFYFFVLKQVGDHSIPEWICLLLLPALVQIGWIVLLRVVKLNASGIFGILGAVACVLLMVQAFFVGSALQMVLAVIAYLLAAALLLMISGGFFPYKYFGMMGFGLIALFRVILFDMTMIRSGDLMGCVLAIPALCIVLSVACFFGGITGVRKA